MDDMEIEQPECTVCGGRHYGRCRPFCCDCAHFNEVALECRRYAPRPRYSVERARDSAYLVAENLDSDDPDKGYNEASWPEVSPNDWCGEFQPDPLGRADG